MSEPEPAVVARRRISVVWIVPAVAMGLGLWLVIDAYLGRGPVVELIFETAEGLEEDATTVQVRNVEVGVVTEIALDGNLDRVRVTAELAPEARALLREDTLFWVVRPRVSAAGISGLGTIVSGAYIEMAPGVGAPTDELVYRGLEQPPPTPSGTPGLRVILVSETSGSVSVGAPVLYRGWPVGRVEDARLDIAASELRYSVFIDAPYDRLVTTSTRFWNTSGLSVELTAEGAELSLASLESLVTGGIAFAVPDSAEPGERIRQEQVFLLYDDRAAIEENPHRHYVEFVIPFDQSVRGLGAEAPVTYRGITIGRVQRIMVAEGAAGALAESADTPIPVLIRVEPGRFALEDSPEGALELRAAIERAVANGLRATLESANLLTGSLLVNLDYFSNPGPSGAAEYGDYATIPSVETGLGLLQEQLSDLMRTLDSLPLGETLESATATLDELRGLTASLESLLADEAVRGLPERIDASLDALDATLSAYGDDGGLPDELSRSLSELRRALESVRGLADTLESNPNALIFPSRGRADPEPRAGRE